MAKAKGKDGAAKSLDRVLAQNKRARHDYELHERYEAGLVLLGSEARSLRDLSPNLTDSFVDIDKSGEAWVFQLRIQPLTHAAFGHSETRPRKLLLHDYEIAKLRVAKERSGMTLIPTKLYYKQGRAKLEVAVAQGRKKHDKREAIKAQTAEREARLAIAQARKG
jgi:SsrA-binding protein